MLDEAVSVGWVCHSAMVPNAENTYGCRGRIVSRFDA